MRPIRDVWWEVEVRDGDDWAPVYDDMFPRRATFYSPEEARECARRLVARARVLRVTETRSLEKRVAKKAVRK